MAIHHDKAAYGKLASLREDFSEERLEAMAKMLSCAAAEKSADSTDGAAEKSADSADGADGAAEKSADSTDGQRSSGNNFLRA